MFFILLNEHENMFDKTLFLNILVREMFKRNECRLVLKIIVEQDIFFDDILIKKSTE